MNVTLLQGRLGNQLFEYAFARAQYYETGEKCVLSEALLHGKNIQNRLDAFILSPDVEFVREHSLSVKQRAAISLYARFIDNQDRMKKFELERKFKSLLLKGHVFMCENGYIAPPVDKKTSRNLVNIGYFQSEKYFEKYKERILKELTFKDDIKQSVGELAEKISGSLESTCLHIRLGDYVKNKLHGVADAAYYQRALKELRKRKPNATIFLFSDNTELVKKELELGDDIFYIPSDVDEQQTLYLGSLCTNFVISNSSFSYWMQYLSNNPNRLVIAPSRWYAKDCPCDIYQSTWVLVNV